jgi:hypothetical protein
MALSKQYCVTNQQHRPGWVSTGRAVNMLSESVKGSAGDFRRSSQMRGMSGDGHKGRLRAESFTLLSQCDGIQQGLPWQASAGIQKDRQYARHDHHSVDGVVAHVASEHDRSKDMDDLIAYILSRGPELTQGLGLNAGQKWFRSA